MCRSRHKINESGETHSEFRRFRLVPNGRRPSLPIHENRVCQFLELELQSELEITLRVLAEEGR